MSSASLTTTSSGIALCKISDISVPRWTTPVAPRPISDVRMIVRHPSGLQHQIVCGEGVGHLVYAISGGTERRNEAGIGESYTPYRRYIQATSQLLASCIIIF